MDVPRTIRKKAWKDIEDFDGKINIDLWRVTRKNFNLNNISIQYYCARKASTGCTADLLVVYDLNMDNIKRAAYDIEHSVECINSSTSSVILNAQVVKEKIIRLNESGVSDRIKIQKLLNEDHMLVDVRKISNILHNEKRKKNADVNKFSRDDLIETCKMYQFKDTNQAFVLAYNYEPFRVLITQKQNLFWLHNVTSIHIDATYRINIYRFPVLVIGFSDFNRKFFCSAICFCQNEDKETIVWILNEIKQYLTKYSRMLMCRNVIGDNAQAITSDVNQLDGKLLRTNCWAHVYRLIRTKARALKSLEKDSLNDVSYIQHVTDINVFASLTRLLKLKYSSFDYSKRFIDHLYQLYMEKNQNWYEAYDIFSPPINNGIERFNLLIKEKYIMWTRLDFKEFLKISILILQDFSIKSPSLSRIIYRKEEHISDNKLLLKLIRNKDNLQYYLVQFEKDTLYIEDVKSKFHSEFDNFINL